MERAHWMDDDDRSPAPLPAHERQWRHPSEVGDHQWRTSEPPIAIGRGLGVTAGAIGSLMAVVLVLTMLSTGPGGAAMVSARSTVLLSTDDAVVTPTPSLPVTAAPETLRTATTVGAPLPTVEVHVAGRPPHGIVATPVHGGTLLVTTAAAVHGHAAVPVEFTDGATTVADVVFVDQRSGLAVLTTSDAHTTASLPVAREIEPGDRLSIPGDPSWSMTADESGSVDGDWSAIATGDVTPAEGAPVLNQRGELVALCSHDGERVRLVPLSALHTVSAAITGASVAPPVWLGVVIADDPDGDLTVGAVDPAGPAWSAGLRHGDVVTHLDDVPLTDCRTLVARLALHLPGDSIELTVRRTDGTVADVAVVLGAPPASI